MIEQFASAIPEAEVVAGHDDENAIKRRLRLFRETNQVGVDTATACFEDAKVPIHEVRTESMSVQDVTAAVIEVIGEPHNYGLTEEEKRAIEEEKKAKRRAEEEKIAREKAEKE